MTRLLLSCDDIVICNKGRYYAKSQDKYDFYQRYLRVFDQIRLVTRCIEETALKPGRFALDLDDRIEFTPIPAFHGPKQYAKKYFKVGKAMRNAINGCDAAVLRIPSTVALRLGGYVTRCGMPYACEVVYDAEDAWHNGRGLERILWKRIDRQMRQICAGADGVSCVTMHYLQKHYYPRKSSSFTSYYSSLALPSEFYGKNKLFPKTRPIVIAHISNQIQFNGRKGHMEIIRALVILKNKGLHIVVKFAGQDYNYGISRLKQKAQELGVDKHIEFVGYLSREELDLFLNKADLFVMPTRAEGLPRVIIEAMAKGLPCITTPVSGNPELIDKPFLVPYDDVVTLAERIEELATDVALYEQASLTNFERSKQYEASILQARRDEFYQTLKSRVNT